MQLKTSLNRVQKFNSFVYKDVRFSEADEPALLITVVPRANGRAVCSGCDEKRAGYNKFDERRFESIAAPGLHLHCSSADPDLVRELDQRKRASCARPLVGLRCDCLE
ncbi:MAG: hypothetical protein GY811_19795 [Myxococcales bacterium]|nr:hypothetical protein [Myxococcales bacterium]